MIIQVLFNVLKMVLKWKFMCWWKEQLKINEIAKIVNQDILQFLKSVCLEEPFYWHWGFSPTVLIDFCYITNNLNWRK